MLNEFNDKDINYMKKYLADAFFAGVGGIELGFTQTNKVKVIYANEFDNFACKTYAENNPDVRLDNRDIHNIKTREVPDADIIMGGFPCQAFSIAGYQKVLLISAVLCFLNYCELLMLKSHV